MIIEIEQTEMSEMQLKQCSEEIYRYILKIYTLVFLKKKDLKSIS